MKMLAIHFPLLVCSAIFIFATFLQPIHTDRRAKTSQDYPIDISNMLETSKQTNNISKVSSSIPAISEEKKNAGNSGEVTPTLHQSTYIVQIPLARLFFLFLSSLFALLLASTVINQLRRQSLRY